jgi:transcriptional regulator NrdR family protein
MSNSQQLIQSIKQRRESFNSKKRYELHDQVKQLRAEIVKNSFQQQPDMKLHKFLMSQLSKARRKLSFSDQVRKELA